MTKILVKINTKEELNTLIEFTERMGLKYYISDDNPQLKKQSIIEIIEKLPNPNIDPSVNLKEQFYIENAKKYGFK